MNSQCRKDKEIMINALVERNLWYFDRGCYIVVKTRITDVTKKGIRHLILEPTDWLKPNGNLMYLSYGGEKYKIITITGCQLSPGVPLELVHVPGTKYYKLREAYFFDLLNYEDA